MNRTERIRKLRAVIADPSTFPGERANARGMLDRLLDEPAPGGLPDDWWRGIYFVGADGRGATESITARPVRSAGEAFANFFEATRSARTNRE